MEGLSWRDGGVQVAFSTGLGCPPAHAFAGLLACCLIVLLQRSDVALQCEACKGVDLAKTCELYAQHVHESGCDGAPQQLLPKTRMQGK